MPPQRNATTTTIAPTGTISIIASTSSGIEPIFALCYHRNVLDNDKLVEVHPSLPKWPGNSGFYSEELMARIARRGSIQGMEEVPEDVRRIFVTAHDIEPTGTCRFRRLSSSTLTMRFPKPLTCTMPPARRPKSLPYL